MASGMYEFGIDQLLRGNVDVINDAISVVVCSSSYTPNLSTDQYQGDIPDAALLGEVELEGNAIIGTTFFANSAVVVGTDSGETSNGVVVFCNTGNTATSVLLAYYDVTEFETDGTDITIDWDVSGLFEL